MTREERFNELAAEAAACVQCERMRDRLAVLGPLNGTIRPRLIFIAEAPGRNGADRTRIPFHGDKSGDTFEELLQSIGLTRAEIFITNSVLCSPRKPGGANDKPSSVEISNCSSFLGRQIALVNPPVIATLGAVALRAVGLLSPHDFTLREHAARILEWNHRLLVPLYHPSPHVLITSRPLSRQRDDYRVLLEALRLAEARNTSKSDPQPGRRP